MSTGRLDATAAPLVMACAFFVSALAQPVAGKLLDVGRSRSVILLAIVLVAGGIGGIILHPAPLLLLSMFVAAFLVGAGILGTAASKLIEGDVPAELRGRAASLYGAAVNMGFGVSALFAYLWLSRHQARLLTLDAASAVLYGGVLYFLFRADPAKLAAERPSTSSNTTKRYETDDLRVFAGTFLLLFTMVAPLSATSFLYRQIGLDATKLTAATFGVNNVVIVLAGLLLSTARFQMAFESQLWLSTIFLALGNLLMPLAAGIASNTAIVGIWSLGEVFAYPVIAQSIYRRFPRELTGCAAGIKSFLFSSALVAGPLATALLQHSDPWAFSVIFGGAPLVALALLQVAVEGKSVPPRVTSSAVPLKQWLTYRLRRGILPGLSLSLLLVFVLNSYLTFHTRLGAVLEMNQEFASSQVKALQMYDYTQVQEQISQFSRGKPFTDATVSDRNGAVIARWNPQEIATNEESNSTNHLLWSNDVQCIEWNPGGLVRVVTRIGEPAKSVVGSFSVGLSIFPLFRDALVFTVAFLFVLIFLYAYITRFVRRAAHIASEPIERLSEALQRADSLDLSSTCDSVHQVAEVRKLMHASSEMEHRLKRAEAERIQSEKLSAMGRMASQIAHDIRSPLAALSVVADDLSQIPESKRILLRSAVVRIRDIANGLLDKRRQEQTDRQAIAELSSLIDSVLSEKRMQFRSKLGIEIVGAWNSASYGLFACLDRVEFKRVLSNLINNSVEALPERGLVTVSLHGESRGVTIEVRDNGSGIDEERLPQLGREGATFDKSSGSGLGLFHAKRSVESWGGTLEISSKKGAGTTVRLRLPRAAQPVWFVPTVSMRIGTKVIILDDDCSVHEVWRNRFSTLPLAENHIEVLHFSLASELAEWHAQRKALDSSRSLYLVDYELLGQDITGLDLIESFGLTNQSVLVTSRFEERDVSERVEKMGIRMIPKSMVGLVPVELLPERMARVVLIDDDDLIHATWHSFARKKGVELQAFTSVDSFLSVGTQDHTTPIYIDENLSEGKLGRFEAKRLFDSGFRQLFLTTGLGPGSIDPKQYPWISAVIDKSPPFA